MGTGITVKVKRPQDEAPLTIAAPASTGWNYDYVVAYLRAQEGKLPKGTTIAIEVTIEG